MTQRIIEWPATLRPGAQEWGLLQPMVSSTSAFSGATFDKLIGPPRWAFSMDLPDAPARMLPQIEAALRQMRGGLNLLRIGDLRYTRRSLAPGGGRRATQLLPWSSAWTRWGRVGKAPASIVLGEATMSNATDYFQKTAEPVRAGTPYVAVLEASSDVSTQVALAVAGPGVNAPLGVVFNALTGDVLSQYGAVTGSGTVLVGGRWRCWLTFVATTTGEAMVHAYALLPAHGLQSVRMRRPQLAMHAGANPPPYVSANATATWSELGVVVDGGGQVGDTLVTRDWPPGLTLKAGHWISYGDGMHQLLQDATPDADGKAQLWVEPPIRRSPADGAAVSVRNVTGLFKLKTAPRVRQEGMLVRGLTLEFEEYLQ